MRQIVIERELKKIANKEKAKNLSRFFKTSKGEYGEGDLFLGVSVPHIRRIVRANVHVTLDDVARLCRSKFHEIRLAGLLTLVYRWKKADAEERREMYRCYLRQLPGINNWDLVDVTTPTVVGEYLYQNPKERKILYTFSRSSNVWKRRIAVLATAAFIRRGRLEETLLLARKLLYDKHDLIHKAVGWMLREVGKKNKALLEDFLHQYAEKMPRTMLRYAIERFPDSQRRRLLQGKVAR